MSETHKRISEWNHIIRNRMANSSAFTLSNWYRGSPSWLVISGFTGVGYIWQFGNSASCIGLATGLKHAKKVSRKELYWIDCFRKVASPRHKHFESVLCCSAHSLTLTLTMSQYFSAHSLTFEQLKGKFPFSGASTLYLGPCSRQLSNGNQALPTKARLQ